MKNYNTTDLDPETSFNKHVFHRDQFAHYLRWTHILKESKIGESICDFGCGKASLLEVLYRNRFKPSKYTGIDIRTKTIENAENKFTNLQFNVEFKVKDLTKPDILFKDIKADRVCSFEVIEHVGKNNAQAFLKNFKECGNEKATYYLSTPNHDPEVGAAGNHTYDSGDGRGIANQEFTYNEIQEEILEAGFEIIKNFGTFASQRDYKLDLEPWQEKTLEKLKDYYDSNLVANIMAPIVEAEYARNILWVLRRK